MRWPWQRKRSFSEAVPFGVFYTTYIPEACFMTVLNAAVPSGLIAA